MFWSKMASSFSLAILVCVLVYNVSSLAVEGGVKVPEEIDSSNKIDSAKEINSAEESNSAKEINSAEESNSAKEINSAEESNSAKEISSAVESNSAKGTDSADDTCKLSTSMNSFSFAMHKKLTADAGNVVFSPYSIYSALALISLGADGATRKQIEMTMRWKDGVNYLELLPGMRDALAADGEDDTKLNVANNGWIASGLNLLDSFVADTQKYLGVKFETENFAESETARNNINQWVSDNTGKRIPELFPDGSFDSMTKMVLANAIYFKGAWKSPFDKKNTRPDTFYLEDGTIRFNASFMFQNGNFKVGEHRNVELLELPYGKSSSYSMFFLRPRDPSETWKYEENGFGYTTITQLSDAIDDSLLQEFIEKLREMEADVYVPKFTLKKNVDMKEKLQALGIIDAFDVTANFSRIAGGGGLKVSSAVHKAYVEVDEEGTKAAAATGLGITLMSMPPVVKLYRPFLFFILNKKCNSIVFAGKVVDPTV